jgi:DNA adenine methylase
MTTSTGESSETYSSALPMLGGVLQPGSGSTKRSCKPFVKWAGGKSQLLGQLAKRVPQKYNRYVEPFVGGGALFFRLQPEVSFLADVNDELVNTYRVIRDSVELLIEDLKRHRYEREYFYTLRALDRTQEYADLSSVQKASRFICLNKTCFNGLYRVNSKGYFNTPFGRYSNPTICDEVNLRACSEALQGAVLESATYEQLEQELGAGDFVYLDPPYAPASKTANFTGYTAGGFGATEQEELAGFCHRIAEKGALFLLSNSFVPEIEELYSEFVVEQVFASRAINSKGGSRGKVPEALVRNYA